MACRRAVERTRRPPKYYGRWAWLNRKAPRAFATAVAGAFTGTCVMIGLHPTNAGLFGWSMAFGFVMGLLWHWPRVKKQAARPAQSGHGRTAGTILGYMLLHHLIRHLLRHKTHRSIGR